MEQLLTTEEVAALFRLHPKTVLRLAKKCGVGMRIGGRASWRYDQADIAAIGLSLRPKEPARPRRSRSRRAAP